MSVINETKAVRKRVRNYGIIGGLLTGGGGLVIVFFPIIVQNLIDSQFVIKEGNEITKGWLNVALPITTKLYIWTIDNPIDFQRGAKPRLREMGPYVYSTRIRKKIISWGPQQESVKFYTYITWNYDQERSVGHLNDQLLLMNVPAYLAAGVANSILKKLPLKFVIRPIIYGFMNTFFSAHGETLITRTTVKHLIEGRLLGMAQTINALLKPFKWFGIEIPGADLLEAKVPKNMFGLLLMLNNTRTGPHEIWTGQTNPKKFDKIKSFKGNRRLNFYSDPKCNLINGTEGISFGSFLKKEDRLYLFIGDLCRSMYASYNGLSHFKGIPSWRYRLPPALFASPDKNPENKCFCSTPNNYAKCDGIHDVGRCQMGAPLAISFPHLLYTGNRIQSGVRGMSADPDKHEAYFDVNPILGTPINGKVRLQINLLVEPVPLLNGYGKLRQTVLPYVWLEIGVGVEGFQEWLVRFATYALLVGEWGPYFLLSLGLTLLGYAFSLLIRKRKTVFNSKPEPTPLEPFDKIQKQIESKTDYLYSNLFNISGDTNKMNPNLYNDIKHQFIQRDSPQDIRRVSLINGLNPNRGQMLLSPPGAVE